MLKVISLAGAVFAGLMGGIIIASADTGAKWWEALSAIGTIIAAIGTVGTLAYQALQNARLQGLLRTQQIQQELIEAQQLAQWIRDLEYVARDMYRIIKNPRGHAQKDAVAARERVERAHKVVKEGLARISSKMGLKLAPQLDGSYRFCLEIATSLAWRPFHDCEEMDFERLSDSYDEWSAKLLEIETPLHAWRRELELKISSM